jgi:putative transposase
MPSTFTSLFYHIVFGTKNREPFLAPRLLDPTHAYLGGCIRTAGGEAIQIGGISDHAHLLLRLKATHCVAELMRDIKKASSQWLRDDVRLRGFHWQDGYSAFSVSRKQVDGVQQYVANQEEHHRGRTFEEEYRELLEAHEIVFDERYLL